MKNPVKTIKYAMKYGLFTLSLLFLFSCSNLYLTTDKIIVRFSSDGTINKIKFLDSKIVKHVNLKTELKGCKTTGQVSVSKLDDGSIEFKKKLLNDSLNVSCTIVEHYLPTENSIRCNLKIIGDGSSWASSINTKLEYPITKGRTKIWATWGAPQFNKSETEKILQHTLRRIEGGSTLYGKQYNHWIDPLVPVPFADASYYFGGPPFESKNMHIGFASMQENLICIPLVSIMEEADNMGLTLALSPEDNIFGLILQTNENGSISFNRLNNRISKDNVVEFSFDLLAHENDWRCGLSWMKNRYPEYFIPKNPLAHQMGGTGAYSASSWESLNLDVETMKKLLFTVNWQASFDFPYMGMFLPPVQRDEQWNAFKKGVRISLREMDNNARKYRDNGFYVLNYFNVTEFGTKIITPAPKKSTDNDAKLWMNCNDYLYYKLPNAILPKPKMSLKNTKDENADYVVPYYTWEGAIATDCGDPAYCDFLLDQACRHIKEIPNSNGICIDRFDWFRMYNERADDGVSWFEGNPSRSLIYSWKQFASKLGPIMHDAQKVIFANNHTARIDLLKQVDGIFDEFTFAGTPLNLTAFLCIAKPALGWTDDVKTIKLEGIDNFFQKYLYMGVFPMCPFPKNDHAIRYDENAVKMYLEYAPLMKLMQGREWVLEPHVINVKNDAAKVNIFKVKNGYSVPVVYGEGEQVEVIINIPEVLNKNFTCKAFYPGSDEPSDIKFMQSGKSIVLNVPLMRGCAMISLEIPEK